MKRHNLDAQEFIYLPPASRIIAAEPTKCFAISNPDPYSGGDDWGDDFDDDNNN